MIKNQYKELDSFVNLAKILYKEKLNELDINNINNKNNNKSAKLKTLSSQKLILKGVHFEREQADLEIYFGSIQNNYNNNHNDNNNNNNNNESVETIKWSWNQFEMGKCSLWGCRIPDVIARMMKSKGAEIIESPPEFPFFPFRKTLYTQDELNEVDARILSFFYANENTIDVMQSSMMAMHDQSIKNALLNYVKETGCKAVTILGGHDVKRSSSQYREVVQLSHTLVQEGFVVVSGGGPGAMEAANLGAYMHTRSKEEVEVALDLMSQHSLLSPSPRVAFEHQDTSPQRHVIHLLGPPSSNRSIGIPTWRYGREASNQFASRHAKFFSSALRLDALVAVASGGIIFTSGGAGTREEIFYATREHHFFPHKQAPFIFFGEKFWNENGVFPLSKQLSAGRNYHENIICTDNVDTIIQTLKAFQIPKRKK